MSDKEDVVFDDPEGKRNASYGAGSADLDDSVVMEENIGDAVKKLKEKLKGAEEKAREYLDSLQRAKADFVNMRKRDEKAKQEFVKFAKADILSELMPLLDALELAVSHSSKDVLPIQSLMLKTLKQHGLEEIDPKGEMFDPNFHEAVGMMEVEERSDDHKILEVLSKGYILSGKVIRPAKVKIGQWQK